MSERLTPLHVPLTCDDVLKSGWIQRARNAILADGYAIRAGAGLVVEAQVINDPDHWMPIILSNGGRAFASADELAKVMAYLTGEVELPEVPAP